MAALNVGKCRVREAEKRQHGGRASQRNTPQCLLWRAWRLLLCRPESWKEEEEGAEQRERGEAKYGCQLELNSPLAGQGDRQAGGHTESSRTPWNVLTKIREEESLAGGGDRTGIHLLNLLISGTSLSQHDSASFITFKVCTLLCVCVLGGLIWTETNSLLIGTVHFLPTVGQLEKSVTREMEAEQWFLPLYSTLHWKAHYSRKFIFTSAKLQSHY